MKKRASVVACIIVLAFGGMTGCTDEDWDDLIQDIAEWIFDEHEDIFVHVEWEIIILDLLPDFPNLPVIDVDEIIERLLNRLRDLAAERASAPTPRPTDYLHAPTPVRETFTPSPPIGITNQATAQAEINNIITSLTPEQRQSGDALNIITLNLETVARLGTTQALPSGGNINAALLQSGTQTANQIRNHTLGALVSENMSLLRNLRTNINFTARETEEMQFTFPEGAFGIPFDNVTIESEFAAITINRDYIPAGGEINIRRVELDGPPEYFLRNHTEPGTSWDIRYYGRRFWGEVTDFSSPIRILSNFWFLLVIIALIVIWIIVIGCGERLRGWVIPTFVILALGGNLALIILRISDSRASTVLYANAVEVNLPDGMRATLALSPNGTNPDYLVLINENGEIQHSRFNPVTGNIYGGIRECGIYMLATNHVSFNDIDDKDRLMQQAIHMLASHNIMQGAVDGYFRPDDPISRTDVVNTIIRAFDMVDLEASATFTDISPQAWYYLSVATAQQMGLIDGFADGTFRGDLDIPKAQLVVMAANTLMIGMGYPVPANREDYLVRFMDRDTLRTWSLDGIALAVAADVLSVRADEMFDPSSVMTRGDAAVVLFRVFRRVW